MNAHDAATDAGSKAAVIAQAVLRLPVSPNRRFVAIAGPPAAGKSTIAAHVVDLLTTAGQPTGLLPMDGFHLDNDALDRMGRRAQKGAPDTFDLGGFRAVLEQLRDGGALKIPLFDRAEDRTLPNAGCIGAAQNTVVVEGNYLLLDAPGWKDLHSVWDYSVFITEEPVELERRLVRRWLDNGLDATQARDRAQANDLPNAELVMACRLAADLSV